MSATLGLLLKQLEPTWKIVSWLPRRQAGGIAMNPQWMHSVMI